MRFPTLQRSGRQRPIIPVRLIAPNGNWTLVDSLVDMGSDVSLFATRHAQQLGIDLTGRPDIPITWTLGAGSVYRDVEVRLELRRHLQVVQWRTPVGFVSHALTYGILGTKGFFEFFTITYNARAGTLDIDPSGPLPV